MTRLQDATVLITGASSGIGQELARQVAPKAKALILVARRQERLEALSDDLRQHYPRLAVHVYPCDLAKLEAVEEILVRLALEVGAIDVLVNNAGIGDQMLFDRSDWQRQQRLIAVNVLAPLRLTHALVPDMVARGRGGILNIGSGAGVAYLPAATTYVASKHFIDGFSENLRLDLTGTGVSVTQVLPGPVETEFDQAAGLDGGMGGPPVDVSISAAQCAQEALEGLEQGAAQVFPGRRYRALMRAQALMPRSLLRRMGRAQAKQLRKEERGG